jgi:hypothetical protein
MHLAVARDTALDIIDRATAARPRWPRLWLAAPLLLVLVGLAVWWGGEEPGNGERSTGASLIEPKVPGVTRSTELTVHGLRHTFWTLLLASNTPIKDVQQVAGHSRASVTLDMYGGAIPGASRRVAGKTAAIWSSLLGREQDADGNAASQS